MDPVSSILPRLPTRRRRPSFVLTSLIDVIFLLVIFFMVTSQITPFSLIPLGATSSGGGAPAEDVAAVPIALRIQAGRVSIGGKPVELAALPAALTALRDSGVSSLVLSSSASATVQDLVSVLEMCRRAAFETVTVLNRPGAAS